MRRGAIVLCGGRSTRMGRDKATLPIAGESMLARVVRRVSRVVDDVVVVGRPGQVLPPLPADVRIARDEVNDRGPLGGLVPGFEAGRADAFFATACDAPLLVPAVVELLFDRLGDAAIAVAAAKGFTQPLCAVYRASVHRHARALLEAEQLRPAFLFERVATVKVDEAALRTVDPDLASLANCNTPEAYAAACERAERHVPRIRIELFERARQLANTAGFPVDAWTLGEALEAAARQAPELEGPVIQQGRPAEHWRASVNGRVFTDDPATRLEDGDSVVLVSAMAGG